MDTFLTDFLISWYLIKAISLLMDGLFIHRVQNPLLPYTHHTSLARVWYYKGRISKTLQERGRKEKQGQERNYKYSGKETLFYFHERK